MLYEESDTDMALEFGIAPEILQPRQTVTNTHDWCDYPQVDNFPIKEEPIWSDEKLVKAILEPPDSPKKPTLKCPSKFVSGSRKRKSANRKLKLHPEGISPGASFIVNQLEENNFRDIILENFNPNKYFSDVSLEECPVKDELLNLANKTLSCQTDRFILDSNAFIVISWLAAVRIFEYDPKCEKYNEVKRVTGRKIELSSNFITSLHYDSCRIYIAYLQNIRQHQPYLEVRKLSGELVREPSIFEDVIKLINSDEDYIYFITTKNIVYIHNKKSLKAYNHRIDLRPSTSGSVIGVSVDSDLVEFKGTKLRVVCVTTKELLIVNFDATLEFEHSLVHCHKFEGQYKAVSLEKTGQLYIIHLNSVFSEWLEPTKIEFGFTGRTSSESDYFFIHELSFLFKNHIIQVKSFGEHLYLFGTTYSTTNESQSKLESYQLGCIYLPSARPLWVKHLHDVDADCRILAHHNHIVIIKSGQKISSINNKVDERFRCSDCKLNFSSAQDKDHHLREKHENIFTGLYVMKNKHLEVLGVSIFKKMTVLNYDSESGTELSLEAGYHSD